MFGTIRKHQTWLWVVIITLTIISFVIFFSPYAKLNNSRGPANYGSINGVKVTEDDYRHAQSEVYLRYFFGSGGNWPTEESKQMGFDPMTETYRWMLLIQKQDQYDIHISSDLVASAAREMLRPFERANLGNPSAFVQQVLKPRGFTVEDFERFVRHYLGIQELVAAVGVSGKLMTPTEARGLYERERQELATEAVFFSLSNHLASVVVTPDALSQFYSNNLSAYRIPERIQVSYVKFGVSNFLEQAESDLKTNLNEAVNMNLERLGTNYTRVAKTPEEAKVKIREEILRERALVLARLKANEFARPVVDADKLEAFFEVARTKDLPVQVTAPFDLEEGPKDLDGGPDFAKVAFATSPEQPFALPISGKDGVYVIAFNKKMPSEVPALDSIRERVVADFRRSQAINLARQAGFAFSTSVSNALSQGKSFEDACKAANVTPTPLPPFSLSSRSLPEVEEHVSLNTLKQTAYALAPGKVSPFERTPEGGFVLYVKSKLPLDQEKMKSDFPAFVMYVRQSRQTEAFNEWFRHEIERGLRDTPLARQAPPTPNMARTTKS